MYFSVVSNQTELALLCWRFSVYWSRNNYGETWTRNMVCHISTSHCQQ